MAADSCPKLADFEGVYIAIATGDTAMADGDAVRAALAHAESCPACAAELAAYRQLHQRLTPPRLPDDAAARIAAGIRAAAHARIRAWERRRRLRSAGAAVAAAALAGGIVLAVVVWMVEGANGPGPPRTTTRSDAGRVARSDVASAPRQRRGLPESRELPLSPRLRRAVLQEIDSRFERAERAFRDAPSDEALRDTAEVVRLAERLISRAAGSAEARRARYYIFRVLELRGVRDDAENEFRKYLDGVRTAEGKAAACRMLEREGYRELSAGDHQRAMLRFDMMLGLGAEGETAALAYAGISSIYFVLDDHATTRGACRKALELGAPTGAARVCYRRLIAAELTADDFDSALRDARSLVALRTSDLLKVEDELMLGQVVERAHGPAKALKLYHGILRKYPDRLCSAARSRIASLEAKLSLGE